MQIKRFEARNMTEALRQIKRELGAEAVILSAQDIRKENRLLGITRKVGVEVTAAVDGGLPAPASARKSLQRHARHGAQALKDSVPMTTDLVDAVQDVVKLGGLNAGGKPGDSGLTEGHGSASAPDKFSQFESEAPASGCTVVKSDHADWRQHVHRRIKNGGLQIRPWSFKTGESRRIALVGSAGVGKTTTIAKMAARLQHEEGLRVGLISLDREKIGGIEQLEIFAAILQIPLEIPQTVKDLKKVLKRLAACDVVLVDTPAIGARKDQRPSVFDEHLRQIADLETWLVVGADTQVANMQLTTALGSDLKPSAVIITKADLNPGLAQVTQYLSATAVPVVGLANGPNVPRDLTDASYDLFARALIQNGGGNSDRTPDTASVESPSALVGQYLANRSSDIFHRPQCKWIRLINKDNIVMFGSFAEALNNRFKPCRYCNPQHMSITGILSQERAAR